MFRLLSLLQGVSNYEIPLWHPIVVHFPIGLLAAGTLTVFLWLLVGRSFWRDCAAFLYGLGALTAAAAYWTGEAAYERSEDVPIVDELAYLHADFATYTLCGALLTAAALTGAMLWSGYRPLRVDDRGEDPLWLRLGVTLLAAFTAGFTAYTAHLGGLMVWGVSG